MVKRRYKPVITRDSVAAALNKLLYGYGDESIIRPLYRLSLVEDILSDRDYPSVENSLAREYALNKSLTEFIFINYSKRRQHRGLVIPSLNASYSEICKTLEIDGQAGAGNWSYFYHRYVRADARIDQKQYAELLAVSSRGLRRYEENVFEQFIQILIDAEWESRRNHIKRYLHTRLPFYEKTIPVEHEVVFNQVMEQISIEQTATIHLTGAAGTGKSALCHRVANQLIEQEQLDHIIWLNHVDNPEVVYDSIWRLYQGRRNGEKHTLRMFLQQHRFLVVLDNVRCQPDDSLNALFADLSFSTLLMTACDYIHMSGHIHHYHLSNLDLDETTMLVEQIVPVGFMYSSADIYAVTQGNPSEIYKYVHQLISDETLTPTVSSVYENMSDEQKRLCLLLSLHFQGAVSKEQLLFFDNYTEQDLQFLMDTQVIRVIDSDRYMLSSEFYQYIHDNELFNHYLKEIIIGLLQVNLPALLPLVEHLLGTFKNYFHPSQHYTLLSNFYSSGVKEGNISLWERILRPYCKLETIDLYIARAMCLRYLCRWDEALLNLNECLNICGRQGWFHYQSEILLETAIIKRNQGMYSKSIELLERSLATNARYSQQPSLETRIMCEVAQIALDTENRAEIHRLLKQPVLFADHPALYAELLFVNEQFIACIRLIDDALATTSILPYDRALLLSIKGRCAYQNHTYREALSLFSEALNYLEDCDDLFAITRARVQVAGVMMSMGTLEMAYDILNDCLVVQSELKDAVGLTATRHNLNILTQLQANSGMT